jgi:hypothetical protein
MRGLWASGATIAMCLSLGGMSALAQGTAPEATEFPAAVTGTQEMVEQVTISDTVVDSVHRGHTVFTMAHTMSDPRVSGTSVNDFNFACLYRAMDTCVFWGTDSLSGPDGMWVGSWSGVSDTDRVARVEWTYQGTAAYAGWTYVGYTDWHFDDPDYDSLTYGVVYEGPPPPWGPLPLPAASPASE